MDSPSAVTARQSWPSLWCTAFGSLLAQLALCRFFSFGRDVPVSIDVNPSNLWKYAYHFPPRGEFLTLTWFGLPNLPPPLNPFSLAAAYLPPWLFFATYAPVLATAALLAMVLFLRELELPRPAALVGGVVYAWQGDLLPFVFPGHYGYLTTWLFFAVAGWAALRAQRHWAHALIAGASCGVMIGLQPDRGAIGSLLIGALYLAPAAGPAFSALRSRSFAIVRERGVVPQVGGLMLCALVALFVSLAAFLALFQSFIEGVKLGGASNRDDLFALATQFSIHPAETFTYLAPGIFGWHNSSTTGPYWGWIGQTLGYDVTHQGTRNLNLAISTIGTVGSILALLGAATLLPGRAGRFFGRAAFTPRQLLFGRTLLTLAALSLVLAWGHHTPLYRVLFGLPLMDKWRNPLKWLGIFNFAAITLSAFGAAQLVRSLADASLRRALGFFLAVVTGLLFVLLLASYPLAILVAVRLDTAGYQPIEIANVMHTLHVALGFAFLMAALLWIVLIGAWHGDRLQDWDIVNPWLRRLWHRALEAENRPAALALCVAALAALQLGWVAAQFIEPASMAYLSGSNPLLDSLRDEGPLVRVAVPQPQNSLLNFYLQNQFAADRISSIDISAASRIPDELASFVTAFSGDPARLWLIGGVKTVAIGQEQIATLREEPAIAANVASADGYTLAPSPNGQPTHALVRLRDYFAKATFIPRAEVLPNADAMLKRLNDPKWNPRASILLDPMAPILSAPPGPAAPEPQVGVDVLRYTPHEIDLELVAPTAGYVLINDAYDPDWQVARDGRPVLLLRADYLLRAVAVAPGPNQITLRYAAHYRFAGFSVPAVVANDFSDAVMLASFLLGFILVRRDERS